MVFISLWIFRNPIKCLTTIFLKVMLAARWYSVAIKAFCQILGEKITPNSKMTKKCMYFYCSKLGIRLFLWLLVLSNENNSRHLDLEWYIHTLKGLNKLDWKKFMETIDLNINEFLLVLFWKVQFICNWFCKDPWFHFSKQQ